MGETNERAYWELQDFLNLNMPIDSTDVAFQARAVKKIMKRHSHLETEHEDIDTLPGMTIYHAMQNQLGGVGTVSDPGGHLYFADQPEVTVRRMIESMRVSKLIVPSLSKAIVGVFGYDRWTKKMLVAMFSTTLDELRYTILELLRAYRHALEAHDDAVRGMQAAHSIIEGQQQDIDELTEELNAARWTIKLAYNQSPEATKLP